MIALKTLRLTKLLKISALVSCVLVMVSCGNDEKLAAIATIGSTVITQQQFEDYLTSKRIIPKDDEQRAAVLAEYLNREALSQAAEKSGLLDIGISNAKVNEYRKEMLISTYMDKHLAQAVSDDAIKNYYNGHAAEFENKKIHVAHILFRTNNSMDEIQRKSKLTVALEAYSKIKAGEDFASVAQSYSEDVVSGKKGGDLGWLTQGSIDERFSKKIFAMKSGDLSEPFETNFGFHVAKIVAGPAVAKQSFESVKGNIRYKLRKQVRDAEMKKLLSKVSVVTYQ